MSKCAEAVRTAALGFSRLPGERHPRVKDFPFIPPTFLSFRVGLKAYADGILHFLFGCLSKVRPAYEPDRGWLTVGSCGRFFAIADRSVRTVLFQSCSEPSTGFFV